ncbi:19234_t:CDS:2 [Entrophospora sp. SA101]|nr:19234_t:CDS:2 [Entrophospora sp. SA101]
MTIQRLLGHSSVQTTETYIHNDFAYLYGDYTLMSTKTKLECFINTLTLPLGLPITGKIYPERGTINVPGRKPKLSRYARTITIRGGEEVYTRLPKREYEQRRELFDDPDYSNPPTHLADYSYDEAQRAQQKLAQGLPLTHQEKELLGLIKKRPGAYQTNLGRAMTPAERKAKWKAQRKGGNM